VSEKGSVTIVEIYLVVIGKTATGYSAHCPDVQGCAAVGKTIEEIVANMKAALELHFEGMAENGDPIPQPGGVDSYRQTMKDLDVNQYFLGHVQVDTSRFAPVGGRA
jgi:predicted RNase H-like HicB family nuclease